MSQHILKERDADPGFSVSDSTPVKVPLKLMFWLLAVVAAGAIAWGLTANRVAEHDKRIDSLETDARKTEQLLIRIDERTAEIKRQLDRVR
jgi:hypothetical protein